MTESDLIDYEVANNRHTLAGASEALKVLLRSTVGVTSLLDVGCGPGTWIKAASDLGVTEVVGVDGRIPEEGSLICHPGAVHQIDLTTSWSLGRGFDLVLCLEVAEHLPVESAANLIQSLCAHGDEIFFSAAIPGQGGQHHVNCQWPDYWQGLFNDQGFACVDDLRWQIWDLEMIEPWYRQNLFRVRRSPATAGKEARIPRVIHPVIFEEMFWERARSLSDIKIRQIEEGCQRASWYPKAMLKAMLSKILRRF